ncbi:hypothetical protein MHYP_G00229910 [Metynnis hypsauchen]
MVDPHAFRAAQDPLRSSSRLLLPITTNFKPVAIPHLALTSDSDAERVVHLFCLLWSPSPRGYETRLAAFATLSEKPVKNSRVATRPQEYMRHAGHGGEIKAVIRIQEWKQIPRSLWFREESSGVHCNERHLGK